MHIRNQLRSISRSWKGQLFDSSEIYRMKKQACKKKLLYWCGKIRFPNLKSTPSKYIHERALPKLQSSTFVLRCKLVHVLLLQYTNTAHTRREIFLIFQNSNVNIKSIQDWEWKLLNSQNSEEPDIRLCRESSGGPKSWIEFSSHISTFPE